MSGYVAPGLYREIVNDTPKESSVGRVDIAAFIGVASRGPLHTPTRVNSMAHFQAAFGDDFLAYSHLAYTVKAFFENGGTRCYIVRVATSVAAAARVDLADGAGRAALSIVASSPGAWGNQLAVTLTSTASFSTFLLSSSAAGTSSRVQSVSGLTVGALVRVFRQDDEQPLYRIVTVIAHKERSLTWDSPLPESYRTSAADASAPPPPSERIWVELIEFSLTLYQADLRLTTFAHLSFVPFNERYIEHVVNESLPQPLITVRVEDSITQLFAPGTLVQQLSKLQDVSQLVERFPKPMQEGRVIFQGGLDGLEQLQPEDLIGNVDAPEKRGLSTLEDVPEVAMIAIPDLMLLESRASSAAQLYPVFTLEQMAQVQQAMIDFCATHQRCIALLDPPVSASGTILSVNEIREWQQFFQAAGEGLSYAALYYPQAIVPDPARWRGQIVRAIPPCGHVAGMFARIDHESGAYHAPANEALRGIQDVSVHVTAAEHGELNTDGINCIRVFVGRGVRIYGARTLSTNPQWRYVNVRRLLLLLKRSIEAMMQWAVFEPNTAELQQTLIISITTLLEDLWQQGAFVGASAAEAFYVKCDEQNNPPERQAQGELLVEVGVAPSVPAEFVVLRIRSMLDTNDILA
jgi:hypothetical protein